MATKDFNFKINGIEQEERVSGSLKDNFEALPTYVKETTEHKNEVKNAKQNKAIGNVIKTGITYIPLVGPTIGNFMNAYDTVSDFAQIGETE